MSQCVPTWDVDDTPTTGRRSPAASSAAADIPILDYEVAELTWENGQVALHGLGPPRGQAKYGCGGTLESIVNQATRQPLGMAMDALVPEPSPPVGVASCSAPRVSASAALDSTFDMSFTSTSFDNTKTTTTATTLDSREVGDEVVKSKAAGKSSVSTKRSRAAAIHNQSERKRRDKINQRMKTLQKLVPNSSKTDKASMLDEVIEYLKQLQAQVGMMSRMNMPSMMMPMAMQQQLQMSMMTNPMGLGMGMGMGLGHVMDISSMNRAAAATNMMMPNPFMPMAPPSSSDSRFQSPVMPDPMAAFLSSQSQPTSMDAYSRMAALYQQMQQQLSSPSNPK